MKTEEKTGREQRRKKAAAPPAGAKRRRPQQAKQAARGKAAPQRKKPVAKPTAEQAARRRIEMRRKKRAAADAAARQREPLPEVVYMPPAQFNRNRFLLHLITLVAVVLALTFVFSIFFKVKTVTVSGNIRYDAWTVREASGIKEGEGLLSFGAAKAAGKIWAELPYVKEAQIGIKLPDTVKINIVESSVAYSVAAYDGTWWLMSAEGKLLEQIDPERADDVTKIEGIVLAVPVGDQVKAYEEVGQNAFGDTIPASVSGQERLEVLKQILQNLEINGVMGTVTTVDVTHPTDLQLWFGEKYNIQLGDGSRIPYKIQCMQAVFDQEQYLEAGVIDVSFTNEEHPKEVVFVPFVD